MGKKALSVLLALAMAVSIVCVSASAEDEIELTSVGGELTSGDYYLSGDVTLEENITIPYGTTVTIDLAGHTLTGSEDGGSVITVNGSLTLKDSMDTGKITGGTGTVQEVYAGYLNYALGGGVYVESLSASQQASFTMAGGTITGNDCTVSDGDGDVETIGFGGGVYVTGLNVTFRMTGGAISGNKANMGAGVAIQESGSGNAVFAMTGGEISDNTASAVGGVVRQDGCGGGIYSYSALLNLVGGTITGNGATIGGGVYACGTSQIAMTQASITENTASSAAGGVYVYEKVTTRLAGSPTIADNTANGEANNLYLKSGACVTLASALTGDVGVTTEDVPADGSPVQITTAETSMAYYADALANGAMTSDNTAYTVLENADEGYLELAVAEETTARFYGATLTLDGAIGVNFYVDMTGVDEEDMENYTMEFTVDGTSAGTVDFDSEAYRTVNGVKYYRYTVYVTSVQMTADINAVLLNNSEAVDTVSGYTVKTYCDKQIGNPDSNAADLCAALLNYGGYAQEHFGSTLSLANTGLTSDPVEDSWYDSLVADETAEIDGTMPAAIAGESGSQFSATLTLDSQTVIRLYFNLNEGADDVTFTVDGESLEIKNTAAGDVGYEEGYSYYVEIQVPAYHLSTAYTITVTDGTDTATITYGAYTYVNTEVQNTAAAESLQKVCKALYFYGQAADAYGSWQ